MKQFTRILLRELRLALRRPEEWPGSVVFLPLCGLMFPLSLTDSLSLLPKIGAPALWVCALFAALLAQTRLYRQDLRDGTLELVLLSGCSPALYALAHIMAAWVLTAAALLPGALALGFLFTLPGPEILQALAALLPGAACLCLISGMVQALTLQARSPISLSFLLTLPLGIPVIIFGSNAAGSKENLPCVQGFEFMGSFLFAALVFCPLVAGWALRESLSQT